MNNVRDIAGEDLELTQRKVLSNWLSDKKSVRWDELIVSLYVIEEYELAETLYSEHGGETVSIADK